MNEDNQSDEISVTGTEGGSPETSAERKKDDKKKPQEEPVHLKTKPIPAIVTLTGTLAAAVDVFINQFELKQGLTIILGSLVVFLIAGEVIKIVLDRIELPNPDSIDDEGNVIEKGKSEGEEGEEESGDEEAGEMQEEADEGASDSDV